jgi:hypothetical protein
MSFLINSNFTYPGTNGTSSPLFGWENVNLPGSLAMAVLRDGTARTGTAYLQVTAEEPGASVASDFWLDPGNATWLNTGGAFVIGTASVSVLAWVRAPSAPVEGVLTIWQMTEVPVANIQSTDRQFTVYDNKWIMIENTMSIVPVDNPNSGTYDNYHIRVEFYVSTTGVPLDIDSVMAF